MFLGEYWDIGGTCLAWARGSALGPALGCSAQGVELIQKASAKQGLVLVHCHEGKSRVPD